MDTKKIAVSGWGKNFNIFSNVYNPKNNNEIIDIILKYKISNFITRGLGRSYGDSAIADNIISLKNYKKFINFDKIKGIVECSSNYSLAELIKKILKNGWFFNVTPGSKFVTIGGAIASDVHGMNHHLDGSFSNYIISLKIITAEGKLYNCSKSENPQLFKATCGGMGLTGIIVSAKIQLLKVKSQFVHTQIIKTKNLSETLVKINELNNNKYLKAWIDTSAKNKARGRSIIFVSNHAEDGNLEYLNKKKVPLPSYLPSFMLNNFTINLLNKIFYHSHIHGKKFKQDIDSCFYPLDGRKIYNLYGKNGCVQFQILIEEKDPEILIDQILIFLQENKQYSFLGAIKEFGICNDNYLSFPNKGFSLIVDLKMNKKLNKVHQELEDLLKNYKTKIYLTKDSFMSEQYFKKTYINYNKFKEIKNKYDPLNLINSSQSNRIGI